MPYQWIYFIALISLLLIRIALLDTDYLAEWVWYEGNEQLYYLLQALKESTALNEYIGGWPLPVFVITVFMYWIGDNDGKDIGKQFLLLPFIFLPFSIVGSMLQERSFEVIKFITHPLVVIPSGYLYIFPWVLFVWVFVKLKLVVTDEY